MKRSNLILALAIFLCALGCNDENSLLNPGPVIELNNIEKTPQFVSCSKVLQTVRIDQFNRPEGLWMRDIHFPTRDIGYGVNTGVIIKTYDGGAHWEIQEWKHIHGVSNPSSLTSALLYAVYFVNPQVGFAGGDDEEFGTGEFPAESRTQSRNCLFHFQEHADH